MNDLDVSRYRRRLRRLWALRLLNKLLNDAGSDRERIQSLQPWAAQVLRRRSVGTADDFVAPVYRAWRRAERDAADLDPWRLPPVRDLASTFALSADEARILAFAALSQADDVLLELGGIEFRYRPQSPASSQQFASDALGLERRRTQQALLRRRSLARSGLLQLDSSRYNANAVERFELADGLVDYLALGRIDLDGVLSRYFQRQTGSSLGLNDFPHLAAAASRLCEYLQASANQRAPGVNVLLYGPPGTGKTELAKTVIAAAGLSAYTVRTADEDGDPIDGYQRLRAYELAQRALRDRRAAVLIFDEVEDVFRQVDNGPRLGSVAYKGWLNERLERNPLPTVWICNDVDALEPAQRRRFDVLLEVPVPGPAARRRLIDRYLGAYAIDDATRHAWAQHAQLTPALLARAARVLQRLPQANQAAELAAESINEVLRVEGGKPLARARTGSGYSLRWLNPDCDLQPIVRCLDRSGSGRLFLFGPPGTGKSAFADHLAEQLQRPLLRKRGSDLLGAYVGESERAIARAFEQAEGEYAVLVFDEVDSLLMARGADQRRWELSQVNELLTQLERFPGVFVATSNLMELIDPAALRRFDYKLRFDYLRVAQRIDLFKHQAGHWQLPRTLSDSELERRLQQLDRLTPGDFSAVERRVLAFADQADDHWLLEQLAAELRLKPEGRRRPIGFAH